jgi:hypothetical protein
VENKKIAVCFFGITRSLSFTLDNIKSHVLHAAELHGDVRVFAHFFDQKVISNPRSGEDSTLTPNEHALLPLDKLVLEVPDQFLSSACFAEVCSYGDIFADDCCSLRNLFHQLSSLMKVTQMALEWNADIVIFVRPDLLYHDSFEGILHKVRRQGAGVYLPNWQHWGGFNDRFSIAIGDDAIRAYGQRYQVILDYCKDNKAPLHSEKLLKYALRHQVVHLIEHRASRVRGNGHIVNESFHHHFIFSLHNFIVSLLSIDINNKYLTFFTWGLQRLLFGNPHKSLNVRNTNN